PILSGTASWLTLALYEACGFDIDGNTITLSPILNRKHFNYVLKVNGTILNVNIDGSNSFRLTDKSELFLDGKSSPFSLPLPQDGKAHNIEVIL
ncbi:MAG: hypothetical protein IJ115_04995, partial [Erysipelotrichaceae bacterium]|nr:hypothetical protein [Erysipelotrichaceae bacterium]